MTLDLRYVKEVCGNYSKTVWHWWWHDDQNFELLVILTLIIVLPLQAHTLDYKLHAVGVLDKWHKDKVFIFLVCIFLVCLNKQYSFRIRFTCGIYQPAAGFQWFARVFCPNKKICEMWKCVIKRMPNISFGELSFNDCRSCDKRIRSTSFSSLTATHSTFPIGFYTVSLWFTIPWPCRD